MIIVTGGSGFIGRNIIQGLNNIQRKDILVVDNLLNGKKYRNLMNLDIIDYLDKSYFISNLINHSKFLKNVDVVFHEGACTNTVEWNGKYVMDNNYQYSKLLLSYCIKHFIPFIYASSAAVYGKSMRVFYGKKRCVEFPVNIYGYSKYLFDKYVCSILPKVNSQICGLRYFNVYGPYEFYKGDMASVILHFYNQLEERNSLTLFTGSKNFVRDFVYVDDIVKINLWIWSNKISGIFDCGTGITNSFQDIANIVLNFLGKNVIKYVPIPKNIGKHYQFFTKADISKLKKLGYNFPLITVKDGIHQYLNWLICNDNI